MKFLDNIFYKIPEYRELSRAIDLSRLPACVTGLSTVHKSHLIYSLCREKQAPALVIAADEQEAQSFCADISAMGLKALYYPARDFIFYDMAGRSHEYEHQRIHALFALQNKLCDVVVACIDGLLQYTIPSKNLRTATISAHIGDEIPLDKIVLSLVNAGYERTEQVEGTGQFAVRGGILDFFLTTETRPMRVEFWGDEIDNISYFDPETQRRTAETCDSFIITPSTEILINDKEKLIEAITKKATSLRGKTSAIAKEKLLNECDILRDTGNLPCIDKFYSLIYPKSETLFDYIDNDMLVFVSEQVNLRERMKSVMWQWHEDIKDYFSDGTLCKGLDTFSLDYQDYLDNVQHRNTILLDNFTRGTSDLTLRELFNMSVKRLSIWSGSVSILCDDLDAMLAQGYTVVVLCGTEKAAKNLCDDLKTHDKNAVFIANDSPLGENKLYVAAGSLSAGFEYPAAKFALITHGQVSIATKKRRKKHTNGQRISSITDLSIGDYVVHSIHGIGIFDGIHKIENQGIIKDYIKIKYAKQDVLYVPVTQLDLVAKYIGPREDSTVKLHKLGGTEWQKTKTKVRTAVKDIAHELIKLYSERMKAQGHAFPKDTEWQKDFEARFEYEETPDQLRCIEEIKEDMERTVPMERLLCGDVGFGKTEVALRAAFKCVTDSKQCVLLVPTTILAWQHYQTILRRFEGFPVNIELLSRFRTAKEQKEIIKKLKNGDIDIIVGTHRLLGKDIEFRDLGLVIIDEEQRFGVAQKEKFKEMRKNIDVLTLSATPIPRTLNMAMSGIRDMSVLEEAPQDRHPVQTYVLEQDNGVINEAIRRELRRGGQVFVLHNSVETISQRAAKIQLDIPEAKVGFGHGKMNENELSEIWRKMLEGEINVLVCTTIIETGVDLPNANTLIIENADRMGLSQLHQIRGRVGRSSRRAYAYLTFTRNKVLSEIAQKRLSAIREFTEFGSGFKIAMRDLELRGAGNILGAQQHGHMEDVGYDMYLRLLGDAVSEEKGEENPDRDIDCLVDIHIEAHIPEDYIENLNHRLEIYRRISEIRTEEDLSDVTDELIDRFGDPPKSVLGLLTIALVRSKAEGSGIYEIKQRDGYAMMFVRNIKTPAVADIISRMKSRATLSATNKPYIAIKMQPNEKILDLLCTTLDIKGIG